MRQRPGCPALDTHTQLPRSPPSPARRSNCGRHACALSRHNLLEFFFTPDGMPYYAQGIPCVGTYKQGHPSS